jgi:hypothetical protein
MIIVTCPNGLANRLFYFAHCITLGEASGHAVLGPKTPEIPNCFPGQCESFWIWPEETLARFPWRYVSRRVRNLLVRFAGRISREIPLPSVALVLATTQDPEQVSVRNEEFVQRLRDNRLVVMSGWTAIEKMFFPHPEEMRSFFTPRREIVDACRAVASQARGKADVLIGMHFRWSDYKTYAAGSFYFSAATYARVMRHCAALFPGKETAFLAISDDRQAAQELLEASAPLRAILGPGTVIGDLYSLAECDYIVCPSSSFSLWAAFCGRKPVWCMRDDKTLPALEDFKIYEHSFAGMHPEPEDAIAVKNARESSKSDVAPV